MRISVAITNYNYGRYVSDAIGSVLDQTRPADEIVVVDDGSTDESRGVLARFEQLAHVHYLPNRGVVAATNSLLGYCSGDIVVLLDADDLMRSERLARISALYESHPDVQWIFNSVLRVDRETLVPKTGAPQPPFPASERRDVRAALARARLPLVAPAASGLSWRLPFVRSFLPIPEFVRNQDSFLVFPSMARAVGYVINEPLTLQGLHPVNRYTGMTGRSRRRFISEHTVGMIVGYEALGRDLHPLVDRFTAAVLWLSDLGLTLPPPQRASLRRHLHDLGPRRKARIGVWLAHSAAVAGRDALRNRAAAWIE